MEKLGFLGGGNMSEAILSSIIEKRIVDPAKIIVAEISVDRKKYLEETYQVQVTLNAKEMLD